MGFFRSLRKESDSGGWGALFTEAEAVGSELEVGETLDVALAYIKPSNS